jgi:hypothetical protein
LANLLLNKVDYIDEIVVRSGAGRVETGGARVLVTLSEKTAELPGVALRQDAYSRRERVAGKNEK